MEWDELRFDVRLLQRVPYEGVSRMQTSLRRRHRDRVVRRGIGMTIESDFYATEAGRAHFSDQLQSIRYCVQETCNFDALYAYLTCGNYDFRCTRLSFDLLCMLCNGSCFYARVYQCSQTTCRRAFAPAARSARPWRTRS